MNWFITHFFIINMFQLGGVLSIAQASIRLQPENPLDGSVATLVLSLRVEREKGVAAGVEQPGSQSQRTAEVSAGEDHVGRSLLSPEVLVRKRFFR